MPGIPCPVNATYQRRSMALGGPGLRKTDRAVEFTERVQLATYRALRAAGLRTFPFCRDELLLVVFAWWPSAAARADFDAPLKPTADALQGILFANDAAVRCGLPWTGVDEENPRLEVLIRELAEDELAGRVPVSILLPAAASPATQPEPATARATTARSTGASRTAIVAQRPPPALTGASRLRSSVRSWRA